MRFFHINIIFFDLSVAKQGDMHRTIHNAVVIVIYPKPERFFGGGGVGGVFAGEFDSAVPVGVHGKLGVKKHHRTTTCFGRNEPVTRARWPGDEPFL